MVPPVSVTVAVPDLLLVPDAVMVTVPVEVMAEGAVNTPPEVIEPAEALQVTEVCPEAVNVCEPLSATEIVEGETVMGPPVAAGGFRVIVEDAVFVPSAELVAVTVTAVCVAILAGAV